MENYFEKSLEMANLIEDKDKKSRALGLIATRLADCTQNFDRAIEIALSVPKDTAVSEYVISVTYSLIHRGLLKKALETVLKATELEPKYHALFEISNALKDENVKKKFNAMIVEYLLNDLEKISDHSIADNCIELVGRYLVSRNDFEHVFRLSELFYDRSKKDHLFYEAVFSYSYIENFDKAIELAHMVSNKDLRDDSFSTISDYLTGQIKQVEEDSDSKIDEPGFVEFSKEAFRDNVLQS